MAEAIIAGDFETFKFFYDRYPNSFDFNFSLSETPLHISTRYHQPQILKFLVKIFLSEIDITTRKLYTPLHYALMAGDLESVKILVRNGANIDAVHINRRTALMEAERYCYPEIAEYLEECETIQLLVSVK